MISRKSIIIWTLVVLLLAWGISAWAQSPNQSFAEKEPDPDRYIVSFMNSAKGKAALKAAGARIELDLPRHDAAAAHIPRNALQGLRNNPNIEYIEPDLIREPLSQTTPWGISEVEADNPDLQPSSANRTICIIDSGFSLGHEDLLGTTVTGTNDSRSGNWNQDSCGHGTHVSGTIAADDNAVGVLGVLPNNKVNLHIVKVFDGANCLWAYSSSLIAALDKCMTEGKANVVSMSLGGTLKSRTEERAFRDSFNKNNILSIAAAGNDGNTRKSYPASYDTVVSVAAIDSARNVASFSQKNDQVELAAPGVAVRSTVQMNKGTDDSVIVNGIGYEAPGMEGSKNGSGTGALFECKAVDGLGSPGDCVGATNQVCLIKRGSLNFSAKVLECQSQGGVAAIIYNNAESLFSGTLAGVATTIQSVGVSGADGETLKGLIGQNTTVTTNIGNYAYFDGTSMATPHVSGVAALVWSQDNSCSNKEIRNALAGEALDLGPSGRDNSYGFGLVQAFDSTTLTPYCSGDGGGGGGGITCDLGQPGDSCTTNNMCCSGTCKGAGRPGGGSCK